MIGPQFPDEAPSKVPERTLRQFAACSLGIFGLLFAASLYRHSGVPTIPGWVALALALLIGIPGLIRPGVIRPIFLGAIAMTRPIGHVVSLLMLAIVYYVFLTPLALIFRLTKRDALRRKARVGATYWTPKSQPADPRRYLRQYQKDQTETSEQESKIYHGTSELSSR